MKKRIILTYIIVIITALTVQANKKIVIGGLDGLDPNRSQERYPVLLALSGGGSRGLTVIGLLRAFEEKGIEVVGIAGTSIGGIIGGLYASGYSPTELDSIASKLNFRLVFANSPPRNSMFLTKREGRQNHLLSIRFDKYRPVIPKALTAGQELTSLLTELTTRPNYQCGADFSKLPIPFITICTDIVSGKQVLLKNGSIADAMRATMAFPLAFTGVERDNQILMDGGMVTPIPVDLARQQSDEIDFVVAINTASKLLPIEEIKTPVDIADQVTSIMTADKLKEQLDKADFVINPPIDDFVSSDFKFKDSLISIGYNYGLKKSDEIITLLKEKRENKLLSLQSIDSESLPSDEIAQLKAMLPNDMISYHELTDILKEFTLNNNYFRLEISLVDVEEDSTHSAGTSISINGYKNFNLSNITLRFIGNSVFDETTLAEQFLKNHTEISSVVIEDGVALIEKLYHDRGYDLVNVKNISIDPDKKIITITIDEAIIRDIAVTNNRHTKDWFIRSYFPLNKKEPYSTQLASEGIRNIYGTDLFDRVTVDAIPSVKGAIVKIGVEEKHSSRLRLGWHWNDEYDSEEFVEFLDDNFGGIGLEYLLHARYSPNRQHYFFSFKADRILSTYLTSQIKLYRKILNRQTYDETDIPVGIREERKKGFSLSVGQQIARLGTVSVDFKAEEIDYFDSNFDQDVNYGLRMLEFESLLENFDRIPFTNKGNKHLFLLQFAGKYVGGDIQFTKFYTSHESYIPLGRYFTLHPYLALGASRSGLPPTEQFHLGGLHSFTGFRTHQLAGDKMFLFSNEMRIKLPFKLYFSAKYDLGEVYNSTDQIKLRNLRNAVGCSLALNSPLGPIEFGYGIVNSDQEQTYLNIGFHF